MPKADLQVRQFPARFEIRDVSGDGRTVYGRIVPYGETAEFVDEYDNNLVKRERFDYGSLAKMTDPGRWSHVSLSFEHEDGFPNTIGYGRQLTEQADGAYATFRLYERDAGKAREMIESSHDGLSLEFYAVQNEREGDVIVRRSVVVRRVGITNDPAYLGARVLAVRNRATLMDVPEPVATPHLDAVRAQLAEMRRRSI